MKSGNLADAGRHLTLAVKEADQRGNAPAQRVALRLELAELQRTLAADGNAPLDLVKLQDAENTLREAIIVSTQASDTKLYLRSMDALAEVFSLVEDFPALEEVVKDAIRLGASIAKEDVQLMEDRLQRLAMAQDRNGHFPEAIKTFDQAIALREKRYGASHVETGNLLAEVGRICWERGNQAEAQAYFQRALRIHEAQRGSASAGALAGIQYELACLHLDADRFSGARELLSACIEFFEQSNDRRLAIAHESLAHLEEREGRVSFALEELEKATKVWEKCNPPQLEELARNLELRAELSDHLRLRVEANHLRKQARHLIAAAEDEAAEGQSI